MISEANILPSSVVFIDDNPVERLSVLESLPGIRCIGSHPYTIRRTLLWSSETQVSSISNESANRTAMIKAQVERNDLEKKVSRGDFYYH